MADDPGRDVLPGQHDGLLLGCRYGSGCEVGGIAHPLALQPADQPFLADPPGALLIPHST